MLSASPARRAASASAPGATLGVAFGTPGLQPRRGRPRGLPQSRRGACRRACARSPPRWAGGNRAAAQRPSRLRAGTGGLRRGGQWAAMWPGRAPACTRPARSAGAKASVPAALPRRRGIEILRFPAPVGADRLVARDAHGTILLSPRGLPPPPRRACPCAPHGCAHGPPCAAARGSRSHRPRPCRRA